MAKPKISPNNKTLLMLKERRLKIEELKRKCKAYREEVDDWARRAFINTRRNEIPSLVKPIVESIIGEVVAFGHGRNGVSFQDFPNHPASPDGSYRFSIFKRLRPELTDTSEDNNILENCIDDDSSSSVTENVTTMDALNGSRPVQV